MSHNYKVGETWKRPDGAEELILSIDDPTYPSAPIKTRKPMGGISFYTPEGAWCVVVLGQPAVVSDPLTRLSQKVTNG